MTLEPGAALGSYTLHARLGSGGMGEVWKAHDPTLQRTVAVKVLHARSDGGAREDAADRILAEARAASALDHPNICTVHEVGESDGVPYIVMAFVEGQPLSELIPSDGLATETVIRFGTQIADALAHAHEHGIVHRDLKSANVVITPDGRAKVLDFGVADRLPGADGEAVTKTEASPLHAGTLVGTLASMAPEVLQGEAATTRSDIWALGVLLYEMAGGRLPFDGKTAAELTASILKDSPESLPARVPPGLCTIVGRLLAKESGHRYASAREIRAALEAIGSPGSSSGGARRSESSSGLPSIAVLAFANLSSDPEQNYFCDGLAEELIDALARLDGVRVTSRTSAFRFKGNTEDIRTIGSDLGVQSVLEGSVRKAGRRLRVNAQLVDVRDGLQLWSKRYDRELDDVFALQEQIARAIVDTLEVEMGGRSGVPKAPHATDDIGAYERYLKGRHCWHSQSESSLLAAIGHFEGAIAADPRYAPPYAGIAETYWLLGFLHLLSPRDAFERAAGPAARALELDANLAEAHAADGALKWSFALDYAAAQEAFTRALAISPNAAQVRWHHGVYLANIGRLDEALAEGHTLRELDPLWTGAHQFLGFASYQLRNDDEALRHTRNALQLDPDNMMAHFMHGAILVRQGRHDEAIEAFEATIEPTRGSALFLGGLAYGYAVAGKRVLARMILSELERQGTAYVAIAQIHVALGQRDEALTWLEQAFEARALMLSTALPSFGWWDPLRSEPRFTALVQRLNLPG